MDLSISREEIIRAAIAENLPEEAVEKALTNVPMAEGRGILVAFGKAAWRMAKAAYDADPEGWADGIVITKYGHAEGPIGPFRIREAGHPIVDGASIAAGEEALSMVSGLTARDQVVVLISGGGSALFEKPLVSLEELAEVNAQLLASGADIKEINTIRKRLSGVKGGRFAAACAPASVYSIILSDVLGDAVDMIASGPTVQDSASPAAAMEIAERYGLRLSPHVKQLLTQPMPTKLPEAHVQISGSVQELAEAAEEACETLGFQTEIMTTGMDGEASEVGRLVGAMARQLAEKREPRALIFGGETVVHLKGKGKGGRNQEIALAAAPYLRGLSNVQVFSFGSDGTDGPTDAAGGWVDGFTEENLERQGYKIRDILEDNNAYEALQRVGGLIHTGPTGTNVNDLTVILIGS